MKIQSDQDAWGFLAAYADGQVPLDVQFDRWPVLKIKISGDEYIASLNSGQMAALVDLEYVFGRAYSVMAHGAYDKRRLKADEEEDLKFTTTVKEGSSILETDFTSLINAFSSAVSANPRLAILSAVVIGLALVSKPVIMKYYENRAKQLDIDDKKLLVDAMKASGDDKGKNDLLDASMERITKDYPQFAQVLPDAQEAFWRFASASVDADSLNIEGVEFSQSDLELLSSRRARRPGDVREIVEECRVTYVRRSGAAFIVGLEGKSVAFGAKFKKPQLTEAKLNRLMKILARNGRVEAKLEIRVVDRATLSGRLISFKPIG